MNNKVILFDLDGTLLPMDNELFTKIYFKLLAGKMYAYGYEPEKLIQSIWAGVKAMIVNDTEKTNEVVFWDSFCQFWGEDARKDIEHFEEFYANDFVKAKAVCGFNEQMAEMIAKLKEKGYRMALATNPIFPEIATRQRIYWSGLKPEDFEFFTTYENSTRCKPNPGYYLEIAKKLQVNPEDCLMVGNDVDEDLIAEKIGMNVFLLNDHVINKHEKDVSSYPQGSVKELLEYLGV